MPSLSSSSSGLARNRNHTVKLSEFLISRSTLGIGIARGAHHDENFASAMSHHRMFTNSCRWMNKPSACSRDREGSMNRSDNNEIASENEKSTVDHGNKHHINSDKYNVDSSDITPINQSATNAILSQLSSPPNLLTLSRIFATPYLSYLLISHNDKSMASSPIVGGGTTPVLISSPIPADAAADVVAATAAETLSTIATNLDQSSTPAFALSLFLLMGFTDFLDGYIARKFPSTSTVVGTYLDPVADKIFISITSLTLCYTGILPGMLVGLWIARDVGIVGSVYWLVRQETVRKRSNQNQDDINNIDSNNIVVMDPLNTPLEVQASFMSKVNTTLQIGLIALGIAGEVPSIIVPPELMTSLIWITAGTTIGSSLGYLDGSALKKTGNK